MSSLSPTAVPPKGTAQAPGIGGMILLESGNRILAEVVRDAIDSQKEEKENKAEKEKEEKEEKEDKPKKTEKATTTISEVRLCDFDDVSYKVFIEKETPTILRVAATIPWYPKIKDAGAEDALKKAYGDLLVPPTNDCHILLNIDLTKLPCSEDELITKISLLMTYVGGGVFDRYFSAVLKGEKDLKPFKFELRNDTIIYFVPGDDRCTIVYSLDFHEKVDRAIAKVFLQEFAESRRHLGAAPPCTFNHNPPLELKQFGVTEPISEQHVGFVSFALLKNHLDNNKKDQILGPMVTFRNYLQYHIKCSKAYFHSRMRARVVSQLKILNRAKTERDEEKAKKTIQGKTFTRAV